MAPGRANTISEALHSPGGEPVSLAQIAAAGIPVRWDEALALIRQIGSALNAKPGQLSIESSSVLVRSSGDVAVQPSAGGDVDTLVQSLGNLLSRWLADTPHPMPLKHLLAQATSTPPFYRSVAELSEALSYYERSNAQDVVRAFYERWQAEQSAQATDAQRHGADNALSRTRAFGESMRSTGGALLRGVRERLRARRERSADQREIRSLLHERTEPAAARPPAPPTAAPPPLFSALPPIAPVELDTPTELDALDSLNSPAEVDGIELLPPLVASDPAVTTLPSRELVFDTPAEVDPLDDYELGPLVLETPAPPIAAAAPAELDRPVALEPPAEVDPLDDDELGPLVLERPEPPSAALPPLLDAPPLVTLPYVEAPPIAAAAPAEALQLDSPTEVDDIELLPPDSLPLALDAPVAPVVPLAELGPLVLETPAPPSAAVPPLLNAPPPPVTPALVDEAARDAGAPRAERPERGEGPPRLKMEAPPIAPAERDALEDDEPEAPELGPLVTPEPPTAQWSALRPAPSPTLSSAAVPPLPNAPPPPVMPVVPAELDPLDSLDLGAEVDSPAEIDDIELLPPHSSPLAPLAPDAPVASVPSSRLLLPPAPPYAELPLLLNAPPPPETLPPVETPLIAPSLNDLLPPLVRSNPGVGNFPAWDFASEVAKLDALFPERGERPERPKRPEPPVAPPEAPVVPPPAAPLPPLARGHARTRRIAPDVEELLRPRGASLPGGRFTPERPVPLPDAEFYGSDTGRDRISAFAEFVRSTGDAILGGAREWLQARRERSAEQSKASSLLLERFEPASAPPPATRSTPPPNTRSAVPPATRSVPPPKPLPPVISTPLPPATPAPVESRPIAPPVDKVANVDEVLPPPPVVTNPPVPPAQYLRPGDYAPKGPKGGAPFLERIAQPSAPPPELPPGAPLPVEAEPIAPVALDKDDLLLALVESAPPVDEKAALLRMRRWIDQHRAMSVILGLIVFVAVPIPAFSDGPSRSAGASLLSTVRSADDLVVNSIAGVLSGALDWLGTLTTHPAGPIAPPPASVPADPAPALAAAPDAAPAPARASGRPR